jgi:xanthine dehydrogenase large subunit
MSVSKPLPHDAAKLHVTGRANYIDDVPVPANCLHLAFGTATIARGRITNMDLGAVTSAQGVVAVLTADDLPFANDVSPAAHDEPLLCDGQVHYHGQPLFLVVADSHLNARRAARLARVEYAPETPILTIEQALAIDNRFEEGPRIYTRGDVDFALPQAKHTLTGSFDIGGQEHFYLEGQAALALPQEDDEMIVHSSTQHPTEIQHKVAEALGLGMHQVRIQTRRMGGGFGGKESQGNALAVACAIAARATGRPCKMRYDRDDDMIITGKRHDFRITYQVGFDDDGRLLAIDFTHYTRGGWAQDLTLPVADRAMLHADNAYFVPHMRVISHRLKTNTTSATAFRGFGGPQGMIGIERVMDHVARHLGRDPWDIRRLNFYANANSTTPQDTHYGMPVRDFILDNLCDELIKTSDYHKRKTEIAAWNETSPILKRGIAISPVKFGISFTLTHLNQAGALVHVYQDGSIRINHGGTEMGQGLFQKVAQVAASRFGVGMEAIKITATDTAKVPNTSATAASSGSDLNGMAVQIACDTIISRMAEFLAHQYNKTPDDVVFRDGTVQIGRREISFAQAAMTCYQARVSLSATGFYKTPDVAWDRIAGRGQPFYYFAYGAAVTEVVIDTLTGENRILRTDILHDTGNSLNPALDIGQIEGAYVQGSGWLTTEELVWDDHGRLRTHAPSTYKIPAMADRPDVFNVSLWGRDNPAQTVYRSKAVGEPPFMLGISTYLALVDAISACGSGYANLDAPATAERVLAAVVRVRA